MSSLCFKQQHNTALHMSVFNNHTEVVRQLVTVDCDLNITDKVSFHLHFIVLC